MTAAEQDLRGEICLSILAFLTFAEFHGGSAPLIDGTIDKWLCAGRPHDPQIARALTNTRRALAHYLEHGGRTPAWLPASVANLLKEPVLNPLFNSPPTSTPSENLTRTGTPDTNPAPTSPNCADLPR
jgi:hypothetical protein